jgi:hypothetical protein
VHTQAILPDGSRLVQPVSRGEKHPLNFGRDVIAQLAGVPNRWACMGRPGRPSEHALAGLGIFSPGWAWGLFLPRYCLLTKLTGIVFNVGIVLLLAVCAVNVK